MAPVDLAQVEADAYWCLSKLLDQIQDHYTFAQPGIQRMVFKLKEIVARIDGPLHAHLAEQGLAFIQFAFRWMNCLLMRELSLDLILRVWDTYLSESGGVGADDFSPSSSLAGAESEGFAVLHVYMCASLLVRWSAELQAMDFQELVMFLQVVLAPLPRPPRPSRLSLPWSRPWLVYLQPADSSPNRSPPAAAPAHLGMVDHRRE